MHLDLIRKVKNNEVVDMSLYALLFSTNKFRSKNSRTQLSRESTKFSMNYSS